MKDLGKGIFDSRTREEGKERKTCNFKKIKKIYFISCIKSSTNRSAGSVQSDISLRYLKNSVPAYGADGIKD